MILLLLCISANVALALLFKLFPKYGIRNFPAIVVNYFVSICVGSLLAGEFVIKNDILSSPSLPYAIVLSLLFITGFNILGKSFQIFGIAFTTIIQKMSILISAFYAILVYHDPTSLSKLVGLLVAIVAIIFVNYVPKVKRGEPTAFKPIQYLYPFGAFLLSGIIEVILLIVGVEGHMTNSIEFVSSAFGMAGVLGVFYIIFTHRPIITTKEIGAGILLGIPNFLTIYLLIALVEKGWDGSVLFPINNIGVLVASTLVGYLLFKEAFDKFKLIGIMAALLSIYLITAS